MSTRTTYALLGLLLESDQPLTTIGDPIAVPSGPRVRFEIRSNLVVPEVADWMFVQPFEDDSRPWMSAGRLDGAFLLRIHDRADFVIDEKGDEILCRPCPGYGRQAVEHLMTHHILPYVLQLRGQPSLHASAVLMGGQNVAAFVGSSGSGKSTLAASWGTVVCDNCLAVRLRNSTVQVLPSHPAVRLEHDSARALLGERVELPQQCPPLTKFFAPMPAVGGTAPLLLQRLYLLQTADQPPQITPLSRRDAIVELAAHVQRLDPDNHQLLANEFVLLDKLTERVPVAWLRYRHQYQDLGRVHQSLRADFTG